MGRLRFFKQTSLLLLSFGLLSACSLETSIKDLKPASEPPVSESIASSKAIKISPGSVQSTGSQVRGQLTITPTGQKMTGSQVAAKVSLSTSRKQ